MSDNAQTGSVGTATAPATEGTVAQPSQSSRSEVKSPSVPAAGASAPAPASAPDTSAAIPRGHRRRRVIVAISLVVVAVALYFGIPFVSHALNTVSTDDAYVNGHVTFVAARVPGQVVKVLVDDNYRVRKGDILVQLDRQPYQVIVDAKRAARDVAKANVVVADDEVRATVGQVRANRYKLQHSIEDVNNQIALLRANVAALDTAKAKLVRADADYQRALQIHERNATAISQQDLDQFKEAFRVGEAQVKQALQQVYQIRVSLGLPEQPEHGDDLTSVPPDLDQTFSTVRQALAALWQSAAPLGIVPSSYNLKPQQVIEEFYKRDPEGNLDRIYAKIIAEAPDIKLAQAKLMEAQSDLDQAELNLSYCTVTAEIDGVVTRRDVNPGNNVVAGQSLMAIRSLTDIWVDANFKETQLSELRIGQAVDLDVDMYGSRQTFKGRISGFTMGTGSTLALLPAENATGNFVKVVQRLPVRIDVLDYDADKMPLFIGLSVTPSVYVKEPPTGPNAGKVLHPISADGKPEKQQ
jgi:membrane fusion protein (multidrug efflux system)